MSDKRITSALMSVYYKEGLGDIVKKLSDLKVKLYSTGGTFSFISDLGIPAEKVEDLTSYPSILGGRVKTLHPNVFGGILARRENQGDREQLAKYKIPEIDLVIVDLYPFEETVKTSDQEEDIIEKIDIGGISLIRAAAKNYNDVLIVSGREQYSDLLAILENRKGITSISERREFAAKAFMTSSHYDTAIFNYFNRSSNLPVFRESINVSYPLRYGENPHQKGIFFGDPDEIFTKLYGKELSYNNLLDLDAAVSLIDEFHSDTYVIIKHNNACGVASRNTPLEAWKDALACDPVSAFGGVIATNTSVDADTATEIDKLFFEIIIAPGFSDKALDILCQKKNRRILVRKQSENSKYSFRSLLNGVLWQEKDTSTESSSVMKPVTKRLPLESEEEDLVFANIIVKHSKSNAIVLAKNNQLCASGIGQTSRVDALRQAIEKAHTFGFDLNGAVMASDAFFPFADCVEIANKAGIRAVVQPGGSVRDQESIDYCSLNGMSMVFTGIRHFKH
ncbi:MAG: bifunctional phosphoribosylaminoimidazolecarboxamide formyltransferase/IMP cyclohydrolase [Bacteroidetes bacterium GWE2_41_25]|nr:MAG: bifunctional phosphoribosylaminoimidazolecarboxamide formyltransferase/IMP cyclohydrolase [Bacteroidetes bacterium GWA2_40_15]OFX91107.1 MAG: bifunctional phosphoribosylaminoimidazolecarboxamide formyltransferase/IMP cyclohydrolase [Bacteroidetes bacterium GWC2_40_22]OFX97023.1 MAG: bifunctional phosphoribosylaminoimidazolecarboxamide formyltransferase/IMP cyclohydrolase [Bacteroidetes bacterium GWE2_41_25]OFY60300.1 MAG: bifunctional phosphoribosylaminoimidazolecarboxamide formyltransfe